MLQAYSYWCIALAGAKVLGCLRLFFFCLFISLISNEIPTVKPHPPPPTHPQFDSSTIGIKMKKAEQGRLQNQRYWKLRWKWKVASKATNLCMPLLCSISFGLFHTQKSNDAPIQNYINMFCYFCYYWLS